MVGTESQSLPVLSRILTRSGQYLNSRPQASRSPSTSRCHLRVDLPDPPPLLPALVAAGARPEVAQAMQAAYHHRACEFREQALATISRACSKLAHIPSSYLHTSDEAVMVAFRQIYLKKLNTWISEGVALLQEKGTSALGCQKGNERATTKISKTFNHRYVPLLEHFFDNNPFPSHADKVFLSKKSGMTYRQIHVWFQNRRNRTKNILHRKPVTEGTTVPLDTLIRKMGNFVVPPVAKSDAPSINQSTAVSLPNGLFDVLESVTPPHAFPTTYPPKCGYDPFPRSPTFAPLEWPRRPNLSSERFHQSGMDIDGLTEEFSRLNVWDDSLSRSQRKIGRVADGFAATSATTVKLSTAPHPALIRTPAIASAPPRMTFQSTRAPAFPSHAFRTPSPNSPMATLIPTFTCRRKIAPLPNRTPSRPPFSLGGGVSERSTSSQPRTLSSRSPSLGSEVSAEDNRFARDWTPNSSSPVTTPEAPSLSGFFDMT